MEAFFEAFEQLAPERQVAVVASDSPSGSGFALHTHRHGQLIHAYAIHK
ncbi:hypothetical protein LFL97_07100 [Burkholderia sp. JSH-S8]|nr:hypothetical protein LFL97_07100 [Burkholderia sp. JSH-S8]